ncbi:MAG: hypothetical protein IKQ96_10300 [Lachnospiraceae bacterium]|nr:hypothetical protein [Lachnospiraceae bacterium]
MRILTDYYSFELPDKWKDLVGIRKKGYRTDLILLWEETPGCSGLLASIKCLKRKVSNPDEYTEFLGSIRGEDGGVRFLYAYYGQEGVVSEENEDLYWRLRDQLWQAFESISPAAGYGWQTTGTCKNTSGVSY